MVLTSFSVGLLDLSPPSSSKNLCARAHMFDLVASTVCLLLCFPPYQRTRIPAIEDTNSNFVRRIQSFLARSAGPHRMFFSNAQAKGVVCTWSGTNRGPRRVLGTVARFVGAWIQTPKFLVAFLHKRIQQMVVLLSRKVLLVSQLIFLSADT